MSNTSIRAQMLKLDSRGKPSCAGECPWTGGLFVGTEEGVLELIPLMTDEGGKLATGDEEHRGNTRYWELEEATEPINGVAFGESLLGVSTRSEVFFYERESSSRQTESAEKIKIGRFDKVFDGGAHGILATSDGGFVAPLGPDGLLGMDRGTGPEPKVRVIPAPQAQYLYKMARLGRTERGDVFACAARRDGLLTLALDREAQRITFLGHQSPGLDLIDVCSLRSSRWPHALAGLGRDQTVLLSRDILDGRPPIRLRVGDLLEGTPYTILSSGGHLFILTSHVLAVAPGLVDRFLADGSIIDRDAGRMLRLNATDIYLAYDRYLITILEGQFLNLFEVADFAADPRTRQDASGSNIIAGVSQEYLRDVAWAGHSAILDTPWNSPQSLDISFTPIVP